jgi:flagellar assembly factor FliW
MPSIQTEELGAFEYAESDVYDFPEGVPAFEHLRRFVLVRAPRWSPLVFLASAEQPGLRFLCLPVELLAPEYALALTSEERAALRWEEDSPRELLAILTFREGGAPTANLAAPVVLNPACNKGLQVVRADAAYGVEHPLPGGRRP